MGTLITKPRKMNIADITNDTITQMPIDFEIYNRTMQSKINVTDDY